MRPQRCVNEYGYCLPSLGASKLGSLRAAAKHVTSPRVQHKLTAYRSGSGDISSSYISDGTTGALLTHGACSQVGFSPANPLKVNQDAFVTIDHHS